MYEWVIDTVSALHCSSKGDKNTLSSSQQEDQQQQVPTVCRLIFACQYCSKRQQETTDRAALPHIILQRLRQRSPESHPLGTVIKKTTQQASNNAKAIHPDGLCVKWRT